MLLHIPQVLNADELAQARALLADAPWVDGRQTAGAQAQQAKHNQQLPLQHPGTQRLQALVLDALDRHALFFSAALPKRVLPPMFNRYTGEANHYGDHVDQAIRHIPGAAAGASRMRTDLSCTVFLNPPEQYDGGELVIRDTFGSPRVKLAAGDAVLYPGTSVHRVEPVVRGERLASFFWIESLVRSDEQRRLLFELDQTLMQLRTDHGERAATVALMGTYHNLLRMWASP